jgi:hypothetical protein
MANDKDSNVKQPDKNSDGDHFNPGNMAGKSAGDTERTAKNRGNQSHKDEETPG